jgi:hypothetical protein
MSYLVTAASVCERVDYVSIAARVLRSKVSCMIGKVRVLPVPLCWLVLLFSHGVYHEFHMILYFLKQHQPVDLCNGEVLFSLRYGLNS